MEEHRRRNGTERACRGEENRKLNSTHMDYVSPTEVVKTMINAGATKGALPPKDLLIRGALSGALLGFATSLAMSAAGQTVPLVGALVFPVGFVMIILLGLELATGSFGLLPLAWKEGQLSAGKMLGNFGWVLLGNLLGSVVYGGLLAIALTSMGHVEPKEVAAKIVAVAEMKTLGYAKFGAAGLVTVFVKAILCNWMVCLGVVMGMTSKSTIGKIAAAWLPIFVFFAQGFEHSIVNMFIIPTGMMLGAKVSLADWLLWNQIPVTLGNFVGGALFTGAALYLTYSPKKVEEVAPATESIAEPST
jgi:formate/nitrite transporter